MTTIIAQSSWPEVCGRRIPRTRCARCHSLSRPSAFPASPSEEKKPASHLTRYRGPPVTPSTPCQDCPSVRGVSQHAGAAIRWLTDARLPSHWQLGVCPQEEAGGDARHEPSRLGMRVCSSSVLEGTCPVRCRRHTSSTNEQATLLADTWVKVHFDSCSKTGSRRPIGDSVSDTILMLFGSIAGRILHQLFQHERPATGSIIKNLSGLCNGRSPGPASRISRRSQ